MDSQVSNARPGAPIGKPKLVELFRELVEGKVEVEDIHARLTENAELARGDVRIDELTDGVF